MAAVMETNLRIGFPQLIGVTKLCRRGWEDFLQRKHNGISEEMWLELRAMRDVISRLVSEEPVRVEERAIVYDPSRMEKNKIYPVEVLGRLHLVRKTEENIVETYELEPIE